MSHESMPIKPLEGREDERIGRPPSDACPEHTFTYIDQIVDPRDLRAE